LLAGGGGQSLVYGPKTFLVQKILEGIENHARITHQTCIINTGGFDNMGAIG